MKMILLHLEYMMGPNDVRQKDLRQRNDVNRERGEETSHS